jgi:Putative Ig domain
MAAPIITTPFGKGVDAVSAEKGQTATYNTVTTGGVPVSYALTAMPTGITFNTSTGVATGTPSIAGFTQGALTATNTDGTGNAVLKWYISKPNTPYITSSLFLQHTDGDNISYTITGAHTPTSFTATNLPSGLTLDTGTGVISGIIVVPADTTVTSSIYGTNATGHGTQTDLTWYLLASGGGGGGLAPVIISPLSVSATEGVSLTYQIVATNTPTRYGISNAPGGWSIDTTTGLITSPVLPVGVITFSISAGNDAGIDTEPITFTVSGSGGLPPPPGAASTLLPYTEINPFAEDAATACVATGQPPVAVTGLIVTTPHNGMPIATATWSAPSS